MTTYTFDTILASDLPPAAVPVSTPRSSEMRQRVSTSLTERRVRRAFERNLAQAGPGEASGLRSELRHL